MSERNKIIASIILLFIIGFTFYGNTLHNEFVWDDYKNIVNNPYVIGTGTMDQVYTHWFRPLLFVSYALDYRIWGLNVIGYHLENILIHVAAAILLFFTVLKLFRSFSIALISSFLFLAHPIQTESVAYISGRADLLYVFFLLASLYLFLHSLSTSNQGKHAMFTFSYLVLYILALLTKESAVVFPAILAIVYVFIIAKSINRTLIKKMAMKIVPSATITALYLLLRFTIWNPEHYSPFPFVGGWASENIFMRIGVFISIIPDYLKMFLLPTRMHYRLVTEIPFDIWLQKIAVSFLLLILLAFLIWKWKTGQGLLAFSAGWLFVSLMPSSNIFFGVYSLVGEHWMYFGAIGLYISIAVILSDLLRNKKYKLAVIIFLSLLGVIYFFITTQRNMDWKNNITFLTNTLRFAPNNASLMGDLAIVYATNNNKEEAYRYFEKALETDPNQMVVRQQFAAYAESIGDLPTAIDENRKLLPYIQLTEETFFEGHTALVKMFVRLGAHDDAIDQAVIMRDAAPNLSGSYYTLSQIYALKKDYQNAIENINKAIQLNPSEEKFIEFRESIRKESLPNQ